MVMKHEAPGGGKLAPAKPNAASSFKIYSQGGTTAEIRLTVSLVLVARRWRALVDEALRPLGQTTARMEALSAILNAGQPSSQVEIANRLRIEGPTMTRMVDGLSRDGLVQRIPAANDKRTKLLAITGNGKAVLQEIFLLTDDLRGKFLAGLDDNQASQMQAILDLLLQRLDAGLEDEGD